MKFFEGVPVPEPSGVALLTVMGATASGMAWRRRQRKSSAGVSSRLRDNSAARSRGQRVAVAGGLTAFDHLPTSRPG